MNTVESVVSLCVQNGWDSTYLSEFDLPESIRSECIAKLEVKGIPKRRKEDRFVLAQTGREVQKAVRLGLEPRYANLSHRCTPSVREDCADIRFYWAKWYNNYGRGNSVKKSSGAWDMICKFFGVPGACEDETLTFTCPSCNRDIPRERRRWVAQRSRVPTCRGCGRKGIHGRNLRELQLNAIKKEREREVTKLQVLHLLCGNPPRCPYCRRYVPTEKSTIGRRWAFRRKFMPACKKCACEGKSQLMPPHIEEKVRVFEQKRV